MDLDDLNRVLLSRIVCGSLTAGLLMAAPPSVPPGSAIVEPDAMIASDTSPRKFVESVSDEDIRRRDDAEIAEARALVAQSAEWRREDERIPEPE